MSHDPTNPISVYLARIASKGGKAGTGAAKVRGDSEHYRRIRAARKNPQTPTQTPNTTTP